MPAEQSQVLLQNAAQYMTGAMVASGVLSLGLGLFIARAWQATLYNPGGFGPEFRRLRLGRALPLVTAGAFLLGALADLQFPIDLAMVAASVLFLQGIAIVHALAGDRVIVLGVMYVALLFALPQLFMLLSGVGLVDNYVDLRSRWARGSQHDDTHDDT
jgi:hypothetical protein